MFCAGPNLPGQVPPAHNPAHIAQRNAELVAPWCCSRYICLLFKYFFQNVAPHWSQRAQVWANIFFGVVKVLMKVVQKLLMKTKLGQISHASAHTRARTHVHNLQAIVLTLLCA